MLINILLHPFWSPFGPLLGPFSAPLSPFYICDQADDAVPDYLAKLLHTFYVLNFD